MRPCGGYGRPESVPYLSLALRDESVKLALASALCLLVPEAQPRETSQLRGSAGSDAGELQHQPPRPIS